jgi:hypothetical protein
MYTFHRKHSPLFYLALAVIAVTATAYEIGWRPMLTPNFSLPPGVVAPFAPSQNESISGKTWTYQDSKFVSLAAFDIRGRVLMNIPYWVRSDQFRLSPLDLVIGWGPMSDTGVLQQLKFGHGYRVVTFNSKSDYLPVPLEEIGWSLSHIHAIPANEKIESELRALSTDDIVHLRGSLVSVEMPGYSPWVSSMSRNDNDCEIMWIDLVSVQQPTSSR